MESKPNPVQSILISNNCDISLVAPPSEYETTTNPFSSTDDIQAFDIDLLLQASGSKGCDTESYTHARHYYLTQLKNQVRDRKDDAEFEKIESTVMNMGIEDVVSLFERRHKWVESECDYRGDVHRICSAANCVNESILGSEYCIQHLDNDINQKLFKKCDTCSRMHPVMTSCYFCNEK